jgi:DNA-binding transcriptional regulator YdaS (Cro superfamily)
MTLLANYLADHGLTQRAFAKLIDAPPPQISMWLSGRRRPGLDYALAIEQVTEGAVPAKSWKKRKGAGR